jgi:hypothetical protein
MKTSRVSALSCVSILALWAAPLAAVDFIRGDVNGDGVVTLGDAHLLGQFLFLTAEGVDCRDAADVDNDGKLSTGDCIFIFKFLILGDLPPPAPFPAPGPDDSHDDWDDKHPCDSYGGGEPLEDPEASLMVLDAVVPGGSSRLATILIGVSNSARIAAASVDIETGGIATRPQDIDLSGDGLAVHASAFIHAPLAAVPDGEAGRVRVGTLVRFAAEAWLPPGEMRPFFELQLCLQPGTPAGQYPLSLPRGDLTEYGSGRRIDPTLVAGTLTILEDVAAADCQLEWLEPSLADLLIVFALGDTTGVPGNEVAVPFFVETNDAAITRGLDFSINFDEGVLELSRVETVLERPDGEPWDREDSYIVNAEPGPCPSTELGFGTGSYRYGYFTDEDAEARFPFNERFAALKLHFLVRPDAPTGVTEIRFQDRLQFSMMRPPFELNCHELWNGIVAGQSAFPSSVVDSFIFINGRMNIIPDVTVFVRGDSNADGAVNISDAQYTLNFLFLGSPGPLCLDAADANDDGRVDISDPIATLGFLFLGTGSLAPPTAAPALDPTPDDLGC